MTDLWDRYLARVTKIEIFFQRFPLFIQPMSFVQIDVVSDVTAGE